MKRKNIKVLSLFDGISCARQALKKAGIPVGVYIASEIDPYAIKISQKNYPFPEIIHVGDIKNVDYKDMQASFDLLIGGSPCQDLSIAKKNRKGLDGERSGLFWEYVRILREVKPKYFILENVASMPKEAKEIITKELGVEPIMINAALVSAQNRKRLFWTNIPNVTQPEDRSIYLKDILEKSVDEKYNVYSDNWRVERNTCDVNDKSRCLNASNYKGALNDGMSLIRIGQIGKGGQGDRIYSPEGKSVGLSALGGGRGAKTGLYLVGNVNPSGRGMNGAVHNSIGKSPTINTNKGEGQKILVGEQIRKLTPVECERLQGLPDNYTQGVSNTQRYKALGNAFNVDVVSHILSFIPDYKKN